MSIKLIAELSMNHMGDMDLCKKMIYSAKESGADYVKFQTWKVKNLVKGPWDTDGRKKDYIKSEMTEEKHMMAKKICDDAGVKFLTSCFNIEDLEMVRRYTDDIKIPSTECKNKDLVNKAIEMFDNVYISTGASYFSEFEDYARFKNIYLLHCVSIYPCPYDYVNLLRMLELKKLTENVGYSGHCDGIWDAIAAISMGALVIEKHFTTDRNLSFRDNKFSVLPEDFAKIYEFKKAFEEMMIYKGKDYQEIEGNVRKLYSGRWNGNSGS